jgi:flagellin
MAIGVQNSSAALLALQTLNRLNESSQSAQSGAAPPPGQGSDASPSVQADTGTQVLSLDSLGAQSAGLDKAASITDAALAAGQSVSDLLGQMKILAGAVGGGSTSSAEGGGEFARLLKQLSTVVSNAGFDGVNLLDGSVGPSVTVGAGSTGAVTLTTENLSLGGPVITLGADASVSTQSAAANVEGSVADSIANLSAALDRIGAQANQLQAHAGFVSRLSHVLTLGIDSVIAPPTAADGARLMALQVQQQLAAQGGSIANANAQVVLSLFK